jgi:alkanesulfonate monooxygenase SsuD/methylene tetrahydromethanopterin reductase-like flavin-dependent oxidoreductase (luciferase family)
MRYALFLPLFGELADPRIVTTLAAEAEEAGWDGVYVWDHLAYSNPVTDIADPWITLAAMATATARLRLGPMVTPLPRRRPIKVAREVATLDRLSGGRVTLGVGIGDDGAGEFSGTGDQTDPKARGAMLDEALAVMTAAWSGAEVNHRGPHYVLDGLHVNPRPVQLPHPPIWVAMRYGNPAPLRRAARWDGVFPIGIDSPEKLTEIVRDVRRIRVDGQPDGASTGRRGGSSASGTFADPADDSFDVVVSGRPDTDSRPYEDAGATWWLVSFSPYDVTAAGVRGVIAQRAGGRAVH